MPGQKSEQEAAIARASIAPQYQAALTARAYTPLPKEQVHGDALVAELIAQCAAAAGGDLSRGETMLVAQAHALDAIFGECARRARSNMGEYPQTADMYLRQALRAQSNCRATWETLANLKNPPNATFVRQANIANGPQQVNNGAPLARAEETTNEPSKLLEESHGERLDTRAAGASGGANPDLEAVATSNRTKNSGR